MGDVNVQDILLTPLNSDRKDCTYAKTFFEMESNTYGNKFIFMNH